MKSAMRFYLSDVKKKMEQETSKVMAQCERENSNNILLCMQMKEMSRKCEEGAKLKKRDFSQRAKTRKKYPIPRK